MEEMKECSFKPKLLDYNVLPRYPKVGTQEELKNQIPIHQRIEELQKEKQDKIH